MASNATPLPAWLAEIEYEIGPAKGKGKHRDVWPWSKLRRLLELALAQHEALLMVNLVEGRPETIKKLRQAQRLWEGGGE